MKELLHSLLAFALAMQTSFALAMQTSVVNAIVLSVHSHTRATNEDLCLICGDIFHVLVTITPHVSINNRKNLILQSPISAMLQIN